MSGMVADLAGGGRFEVRRAIARTAAGSRRGRLRAAAARMAAPAQSWPVVLFVLVPAFFFRGPLASDQALALGFVFFGMVMSVSGAALLAAGPRSPDGGTAAGRILGAPVMLLGLLLAAMPQPGMAVLAASVALCQAARYAVPPLPSPARLLLTALSAALALDAGATVLGMPRGFDLVAWAAAVAMFGELVAGKGDLVLRGADSLPGRRHSATCREIALGLAGLAALVLYLMRLPPPATGTLWETLAAYAAFAFFLTALWRGLRSRAGEGPDPLMLAAVAGWALGTGFAHGSVFRGLPLDMW